MLHISEIMGKVISSYTHTDSPICVIGDFSVIKCSGMFFFLSFSFQLTFIAILGLASIGRSVVFVPQDSDSAEIANVIDQQNCEVVMIRRSRLPQLESALDTSYGKSLRVVLYTECSYLEKAEMGDILRCEETLIEEYNLDVNSLSHIMNTEYSNYGMKGMNDDGDDE